MKTLSASEIEKAGRALRLPTGEPPIQKPPAPEPPKPDPILPLLERLAGSFDGLRAALKELKPQNNDALIAAMNRMLDQNEELTQAVKDMIEIGAHQERIQEEVPGPEAWDCVPEHDSYGRIKRVRITRV